MGDRESKIRSRSLAAIWVIGIAILMFFIGWAIVTDPFGPPGPPAPKSGGGTRHVPSTIVVDSDYVDRYGRGHVLDFGGDTFVWTGPGTCDQTEGQDPIMIVTAPGVTLRNFKVRGAPDGIHLAAKKIWLEDVHFLNVCEDAITMQRGAEGCTVKRCSFEGGEDKVAMVSYGRNHAFRGNRFTGAKTAVKVWKGAAAEFDGNWFQGCTYGVRAQGPLDLHGWDRTSTYKTKIVWRTNHFEGTKHPVSLEGAAMIEFLHPEGEQSF